ncbi:MAG: hypothetical protein EA359_10720 [Balneolaceae bacterium]|nr:MAG: hypothetical protein EA359_10720 [Balneolaceae bacterium]
MGRYKNPVWIIGSGRSGSTWLLELIGSQQTYRILFEPFHSKYVTEANFLKNHFYLRPGDVHPEMEHLSKIIFTGNCNFKRVDMYNRSKFYTGLLIKDIYANLFAKWVYEKFPDLKIIYLIRHPCEVAVSKYITRNFKWLEDPSVLLQQKDLYEDYLAPYSSLIHKIVSENDYILNQVLLWSIINFVPLKQFKKDDIHIVFYENLLTDTEKCLNDIFSFIYDGKKTGQINIDNHLIGKPSSTVFNKNKEFTAPPLNRWKDVCSKYQINKCSEILDEFGLSNLYGDDGLPLADIPDILNQKSD